MSGEVAGGNIRCLLKLAGTPFWPQMEGKILFLEAYGGGPAQMTTYLSQLRMMGVFEKVSGILLGTFTKMEEEGHQPDIAALVKSNVKKQVPIAKTQELGHGIDSKCLALGRKIWLSET